MPEKRSLLFKVVTTTIKIITRILLRIDDTQLARVPRKGPLIIIGNHINFLETPVVFTHLQPRPATGLAKVESWDNPFYHFLFDLWEGIPIRRGEVDLNAFKLAREWLSAGKILAIAPEGTRSGHGRLQEGLPGSALLALRARAPVLPVVCYGGEKFWYNIKRLKRTDFNIVVGNPFSVDDRGEKINSKVSKDITTEMMCQMAALLPPPYRGVYADLDQATEYYLRFEPGVESNLARASE